MEKKPAQRNTDTRAASMASRAAYARRRHARYIEELRAAGVTVEIPEDYTGLPMDEKEEQ